jgi:hypothetical protein
MFRTLYTLVIYPRFHKITHDCFAVASGGSECSVGARS